MRILSRTVGPFEENSYLVIDEESGRAVLIDPGDEPDVLMEMVRESGAQVERDLADARASRPHRRDRRRPPPSGYSGLSASVGSTAVRPRRHDGGGVRRSLRGAAGPAGS